MICVWTSWNRTCDHVNRAEQRPLLASGSYELPCPLARNYEVPVIFPIFIGKQFRNTFSTTAAYFTLYSINPDWCFQMSIDYSTVLIDFEIPKLKPIGIASCRQPDFKILEFSFRPFAVQVLVRICHIY